MIAPTRRTILLYLAGTFLLGALAGGAAGYGYGRRPVYKPFNREEMRTKFCNRLSGDLNLSPQQQEQLDPIVRQNMDEFESAHREHYGRIGELMKRHRERVASILNPEQKAKFEAMEKERERRMPKRGERHGTNSESGSSLSKPATQAR